MRKLHESFRRQQEAVRRRLFDRLSHRAMLLMLECQVRADFHTCCFYMSREDIMVRFGWSDREARKAISLLVAKHIIVSMRGKKWEYLPCVSGNGDRLDITCGQRDDPAETNAVEPPIGISTPEGVTGVSGPIQSAVWSNLDQPMCGPNWTAHEEENRPVSNRPVQTPEERRSRSTGSSSSSEGSMTHTAPQQRDAIADREL